MYAVKYKDLLTGESQLGCMTFFERVAIKEADKIKLHYYKLYEARVLKLSFWKMLFGLEKIEEINL